MRDAVTGLIAQRLALRHLQRFDPIGQMAGWTSKSLDLVLAKKRAFAEHGDDHGLVGCELTGVMVSIDDAHLDHAWPNFSHIVSGFRAARGWSSDIPDGVVSAPADGQTTPTFVDKAVADAFRDYHHS